MVKYEAQKSKGANILGQRVYVFYLIRNQQNSKVQPCRGRCRFN
jgi:hypothetical protein